MKMKSNIIPFLLACAFLIQPALAEAPATPAPPTTPPAVVHSPIMPVKIKPRQSGADSISKAAADIEQENTINANSLGLFTRISDGGLGGDVWKNYTGKALASDLGMLNVNISSPAMRALLLRALLTSPDAETLPEDKESEAFSARITTLVDLGAFDETVVLYKKLEGNIPSGKAALAGTEAMVSMGQMGISCLEEKALPDDMKGTSSTSFWPDLEQFCNILLTTDATDDESESFAKTASLFTSAKQLTAPATLSELNGKSVIGVLAMNKSGLIPKNLFTPENIKPLKPQIISLLLKQSPIDPQQRLSLLSVAVEKGMVPSTDFTNEFITQTASSSTSAPSYWSPFMTLYNKLQSSPADADKSVVLKEVLKIAVASSNAALLPFGASFGSLKNVDTFTTEEARKVVSLLVRAKINVSGAWYAKAFGRPDAQNRESVTDLDVISALKASLKSNSHGKAETNDNKEVESKKSKEMLENPKLYALSLILKTQEAEDKIKEKSYENLFSLTGSNDYVMPSKELMNNLAQVAAKQDTGKVIIYSLQILNGQRISQIHPLALIRISEGLQSVGLSEENRSLAHEVLADLIEY
ncbi:MAG: hypothetical protein DI586_06475 [Micavibrio aeruginosavorus]|uniref:Antifreeze glycopeptide n=1 Tax=Micavibrio aeruginosavorus TaxID=349221 RepID=A0A2W5FME0_9BACT|nr:MAG: hypothetical protein DI586_06475 [Micavibrio aeruginosavorus]